MTRADGNGPGVGARLDALGRVVELAKGRIDDAALEPARTVLERAAGRYALSAEHTLVVLAGATGVGKSSLFNTLVGIGLSPVAVRRPTTSEPLACVWEAEGLEEARPLLDRLGVSRRKQLCRESPLDLAPGRRGAPAPARDPLAGLVLVDLPDHDSLRTDHREIVDHAVQFADLLIWVTDPQKYADADWHDEYLKPLSAHGGVTLILLNQVDKLPAGALPECLGDLRRLVDADGLEGATLLPVSARTGDGIAELRAELAELVAGRRAASDRLGADVDQAAAELAPLIGLVPDADQIADSDRERALAGLRAAAGVSSLADAVAARAAAHALPLVSSPLRALGRLGRKENVTATRTAGPDVPAAVPVDRGGLDQVLGQFANAITQKLPDEWGRSLRTRLTGSRREVAEQLDAALGQCELTAIGGARQGTTGPRVGHVLLLLLALAGAIGAIAGAAGATRNGPALAGAGVGALVVGLLGTLLLDVRARASARGRAIKAGQVAAGSLAVELAAVAQDGLFAVAEAELDRHRRAYEAFRTVYG
ncbi:50S ribosome-binding GTPase [Actinospica sp. MGRD01-02]|uniref:50S ribosome-binding GTPase n=1 Tax=Actinospica acidithermotolerans TaxID=2828514 RepID=A0A941E6Z4_9ACTN|nr:GTPase [Actinospica acidithermotolerans]MBR7826201.1 50S ribosome-binding GTPase [Actinospica acidithermotolerans]